MALLPSCCRHCLPAVTWLLIAMAATTAVASLYNDIEQTWGADHSFFYMDGDGDQTLALCLDETRGSGFQSKEAYLYARYDIDVKLVANDSAGTVTTVYLMPDDVPWEYHDEVDMEFLGNVTGEPYTLHTNIFVNGVGHRVQQFRLWFDPTADFHTYSIVWNPKHIIFLVDGVPIRDYENDAARGVPFPTWQRMRLYGTLWNADDWATQGGRFKTDWTQAPFYAYYRNFSVTPCVPSPGVAWCGDEPPESAWFDQGLDAAALQRSREEHMIYDYCRNPNQNTDQGLPRECTTD
ncbi:xyloglucan endotransglucosylase/hydrolase protein 24-like [Phragmites australis]|uniref:xyloglucan endotransglucosylase/hydrolase protein 24-like n=1 Tax=Phragmites australis TaxID=29695 RepID=UPI002D77CC87|nr:xyloglucan endotransglucosylase/hydrolase protein 24-like [Phragmites australis]